MESLRALGELDSWLRGPSKKARLDGGDTCEDAEFKPNLAVPPAVPRRLRGKQADPNPTLGKKRGRAIAKDKQKSKRRHREAKNNKSSVERKARRATAMKASKPKMVRRLKASKSTRQKYEVPDWRQYRWTPSIWKQNTHAREFERSILTRVTEEMCSTLYANLLSVGDVEIDDKGEQIVVTYATICSGSDIINLALENLATAIYEKIGLRVVFRHVWACEWDDQKRHWIAENYSVPMIFDDVCTLMSEEGSMEYRSNTLMKPTPARIIIAGTSCKDASRMSSKQEASRDCISKGSGSTGSTFVGLRTTVQVLGPDFVFLENVAGLLDKIKTKRGVRKPRYASNFLAIVETFRQMGYSFCHKIFNAMDCHVPQRRERLYMCARLAKCDDDAPHEPETQNLLQARVRLNLHTLLAGAHQQLGHVRFEDFLLPKEITDNAHEAIKDWIPEGTKVPEEEEKDRKWLPYHEKEWAHISEASKAAAFEKINGNPWCENFCDRMRDLLLLQYAKQEEQLEKPTGEVVWDLSQNPARIPTAHDGIPCAMPRAVFWLSKSRRRLLGVESLALQGADMASLVAVRPGVWPNRLCQDLAGNAFCVSQCVAWLVANLMSAHGR
jgi:site-specific DNA-cytosine methylase